MFIGSSLSDLSVSNHDFLSVGLLVRPLPIQNIRHVLPVFRDVLIVVDELVVEKLFCINAHVSELQDSSDHVLSKMEAIKVIKNH